MEAVQAAVIGDSLKSEHQRRECGGPREDRAVSPDAISSRRARAVGRKRLLLAKQALDREL